MGGVTHQEDSPLSEVLGHQLPRLPVRDFHDLDRQIRLAYSNDDQFLTPLDGVILRGFFLDRKHSAIRIGDQEEAPDTWPVDEDRVIFVAADQLAPFGSKVDEDIMLIEHSQSFPIHTERFANVAMSAISG